MRIPIVEYPQIVRQNLPEFQQVFANKNQIKHFCEYVTGLIAEVEEKKPDCGWQEILSALEDQGFEAVEFQLGPLPGNVDGGHGQGRQR